MILETLRSLEKSDKPDSSIGRDWAARMESYDRFTLDHRPSVIEDPKPSFDEKKRFSHNCDCKRNKEAFINHANQ